MARYTIIGPRRINGAETGEVVELDETRVNVAALEAAGHIRREAVSEVESAEDTPLDSAPESEPASSDLAPARPAKKATKPKEG